eukprot:CAMPEP_0171143740 /NCGR_PEP_ID=MMETSP0766_2-20121228/144794_1 /TAXON_ID=439317 /ORGANISM="Gambierdiscus australes, Strain CAWD 149" /LENGTH=178 /DNA_ID=CAMNT_0011607571 /DNA_START=35 /DNA_END=571 /DNA_ORIENTATION=-
MWVRALALLPGGLLASSSLDHTIRLWALEPGEGCKAGYLLLSGRTVEEEEVAYVRQLRGLLEARDVPVLMAHAGVGEPCGDIKMERLSAMKALCAVCYADFASDCESYPEVQHACRHSVPIFAVQHCEWWQVEPPDGTGGDGPKMASVFDTSLLRVDGRTLSAEGVAAIISGVWDELP